MLTRRATIHPDAAVVGSLDLIDEVLQEGGFLEACDAAAIVPPTHFSSWKDWKICALRRSHTVPSEEGTLWKGSDNRTSINGEDRPIVILSTALTPAENTIGGGECGKRPQSLTQMRRSVGFLPLLAHRSPLLRTILLAEPYNMPESILEQLVRISDLASLVRRMGSKGVHFDSTVAMDLVMLISRVCTWYWREESKRTITPLPRSI